jgi:hypothetical protein
MSSYGETLPEDQCDDIDDTRNGGTCPIHGDETHWTGVDEEESTGLAWCFSCNGLVKFTSEEAMDAFVTAAQTLDCEQQRCPSGPLVVDSQQLLTYMVGMELKLAGMKQQMMSERERAKSYHHVLVQTNEELRVIRRQAADLKK